MDHTRRPDRQPREDEAARAEQLARAEVEAEKRYRVLKSDEVTALVQEKTKQFKEQLDETVQNIHPSQRFLILARLVNYMWASVYRPVVEVVYDPRNLGPQ